MSDAAAARWVARAWMLLAASSALYFLADNEADNDLWVHLFAGKRILASGAVPHSDDLSYTAAGLPWVDHEWLTQAALAALFDVAGSTGLWLGKLAIALLTAALTIWYSVVHRAVSWWVRGPVLILVFAVLARGYAIRPQIVTYLAVAALLAWLDRLDTSARPPRWSILVVVAIGAALWANAHGGFILGLAILGLYAIAPGAARRAAGASAFTLPLAMLVVAAVAACLNPYGPALFSYIAGELTAPHPLTEWQPVALTDAAHLPFVILLGAWIATLPFSSAPRRQPWRTILIAGVAVMSVRHQRHTPLLALCAAAPLAEQLQDLFDRLRSRVAFRLSAPATAVIAIALGALSLAQLARVSQRVWLAGGQVVYAAEEYPVGALQALRERGSSGNLALPLDWGGYALWHAAPGVRVSLDGRFATVYPPRIVEDNFAFFRNAPGDEGSRLLDAYDTTLVLVPHGTATPLDGRVGWSLLYADAVASLYGKGGPPAARTRPAPQGWLHFP